MLRKFRNVKSISYLWKVEENFETFCQDQLANLDRCCPDVSGVEVMEENLRELENQVAFILLQMPNNYQGRWRELWYIAWAVCLQICHAKEAGCPQGFKLPQQSFFFVFLVASFVSMCNEMHDIPVNLPECSHRAAWTQNCFVLSCLGGSHSTQFFAACLATHQLTR